MDGYRKHCLLHSSQLAAFKVEDVTDVCNVGDPVFVKVMDVVDGAEPREQRISLSMKLVSQSDGVDLDPSNEEAQAEAQRRKPRHGDGGDRGPLQLDAVFNTTCTKCDGRGHMAYDCYNRGGEKYDLVPEDEPPPER
ncbi:unnamed protein product, partial [Discosporangium mesarthrocarpum]